MKTKRRSPIKTEAEVAREVDDALALFGIDCPRQNTGGMVEPPPWYHLQFADGGRSMYQGIELEVVEE